MVVPPIITRTFCECILSVCSKCKVYSAVLNSLVITLNSSIVVAAPTEAINVPNPLLISTCVLIFNLPPVVTPPPTFKFLAIPTPPFILSAPPVASVDCVASFTYKTSLT